ncbi:hypothetical protein HCN44_008505 [Aphidius gifuensis]|uniref:PDZ domain-containing protein n=1 Tax=Aphidius gifuensis TaxID=684658 RepID=A0A834XNA0_APHGI|nr:uncharacterized protein LOC122858242 [Aphidius gifuensis]KAF7989831.1 hypothetical protein HCN44_008505 [Aphidius gifuensis]
MRWFRGNVEAPKLLSLSPLRGDDTDADTIHFRSRSRDKSPVRWPRRKSSSPEKNCYNVQTSKITTEKCSSSKKDKKKIHEERKKFCEKKNPLLDRVKNTRLSFFKDKINDDYNDDSLQCNSMCDIENLELKRTDNRRSICEIDFKKINDKEKLQIKKKTRSKSHTRISLKKNIDDKFNYLGFNTSTSSNKSCWSKDDNVSSISPPKTRKSFHGHKNFLKDYTGSKKTIDIDNIDDDKDLSFNNSTLVDSHQSPSSCLASKFRAMQDRYVKSSTNRLIAKIYRKDVKDNDKRRLRSFSYGALPGLEELRTNPLFEDHEQDDNDSGILDSGSATSSLFDDRCGSGASGLITNDSSPSQILPKTKTTTSSTSSASPTSSSSSSFDLEQNQSSKTDSNNSEYLGKKNNKKDLHKIYTKMSVHNLSLGIEKNPLNTIYNIKKNEIKNDKINLFNNENDKSKQLKVVRSSSCTTETIVLKLKREFSDQSLGIFIAKNKNLSNGYLVAHVVPNGLADKEGTLKIGDEILIVNGKRLKGLDMSEARCVLGSGNTPGDVDIVISRYINIEQPKKLKESSVDYENITIDNNKIINDSIDSPKLHFKKNHPRHYRDKKNESARSINSDKCRLVNSGTSQISTNFCTLPRRPKTSVTTFHTVVFEKGHGKKSLGFTIVGGRDSPKGSIGIFIKSVLPGGQAAEDGRLRAGDEILAVNGQVSHDLTHRQAVQLFRNIKSGSLALHLCRRVKQRDAQSIKAKSCADLLTVDA